MEDDRLLAQRLLDPLVGSARTLAPAIGQILAEQGRRGGDIGLIAVATGPGSFTGLRVGTTTAKMLAYALRCGIIGVDTLDVVAEQAPVDLAGGNGCPAVALHAIIDAQRRELFVGQFERAQEAGLECRWRRVAATQIVPADDWLHRLAAGTLVTGPGLKRLVNLLPPSVVVVPAECWNSQAATVGRLGWTAWQSGRRDDPFQLVPQYFRPSYAEEKAGRSGE